MLMLSVSNVIYHKFSHGAAFYMLNGKNVNVMLESSVVHSPTLLIHVSSYKFYKFSVLSPCHRLQFSRLKNIHMSSFQANDWLSAYA